MEIPSFVKLAMTDDGDIQKLAGEIGCGGDELGKLVKDMKTVVQLWLASMTPKHFSRMDELIIEKSRKEFPEDVPRDTAMLRLRDYINPRIPPMQAEFFVQDGELLSRLIIHVHAMSDASPMFEAACATIWADVFNAIKNDDAYRICAHCGEPFVYRSQKAIYCSGTCRAYASRERNTS